MGSTRKWNDSLLCMKTADRRIAWAIGGCRRCHHWNGHLSARGAAAAFYSRPKNNLAAAVYHAASAAGLAAEKGSKEEKLEIARRQVSFISTPDNKLRSFYIADGDFHLVTTSRKLASRSFSDEGPNRRALGWLPEFRLARQALSRGPGRHSVHFFSRAMFENLAGPHYRIETNRRLKSAVELEMLSSPGWPVGRKESLPTILSSSSLMSFCPRVLASAPTAAALT